MTGGVPAIIVDVTRSYPAVGVEKNISVNIYGKDDIGIIFNKELKTEKGYLVDIIEEIPEAKIVVEDGLYGAYITSIMDIEQGDGYYWSYYINGNYASEGISNCVIGDNIVYDFKIEKY
jgi:hypothetical protein